MGVSHSLVGGEESRPRRLVPGNELCSLLVRSGTPDSSSPGD